MAMAEDAATVGGIDWDGVSDGGQAKGAPGKKIADDGLQVAVAEPWMGLEWSKPGRSSLGGLAARTGLRHGVLPGGWNDRNLAVDWL